MKSKSYKWLYIAGLFGLFAVWASSMGSLETLTQKFWVSIILLAIACLFVLQGRVRRIPHGNLIRNILETGLASCLFLFKPGWTVFPIVFFVLSPQVMIDFPLKVGMIWLVVYTLITGFFLISTAGIRGLLDLLPFTAGYVFFGLFGWTMVQAQCERERSDKLLADLKIVHEKLQRYTEQVEELTIAEERNRIAREMHDTLGHRLTIASVQLEGAQRLISTNPQKVDQIIRTVQEQVKEGLTELRRTVAMMRAPVDDDLPLPLAMTRLVNQVTEATGMNLHLDIADNLPGLPFSHRQALFRAAQEGLTNIERHASATETWIRLYLEDGHIFTTISDNGVGLDPDSEKSGLGLRGMQERATLLNGELKILPRPGGGTQLSFSLPVPRETSS